MRSALLLGSALALSLGCASVASAARPTAMVFYGGIARSPVVITGDASSAAFVEEIVRARPLSSNWDLSRPFVRIAVFWGSRWRSVQRVRLTTPSIIRQADQVGKLFPAIGSQPAAIDLPWHGSWPRELTPRARSILMQHGVPTEIKTRSDAPLSRAAVIGVGSSLMLGAVTLIVLVRRRL